MANDGIEVAIASNVSAAAGVQAADETAAVDEHLVEAPDARLVGILIAKVPFAEDPGGVARGLEHLRERNRLEAQAFALELGVRDAGFEFVPAGHQRRPGSRARWADMKIRKLRLASWSRSRLGVLSTGFPWQDKSP